MFIKLHFIYISLALAVIASGLPSYVQAQTTNQTFDADPSTSTDISFRLSPKFPGPNESVSITAFSYGFDMNITPFSWYINGSLSKEFSGVGKNTARITTGAVGTKTTIRVVAAPANGRTYDVTTVIYPTDIALMWRADTYTPPGYQGKSLPAIGSTIHIVALPRLSLGTSILNPASLNYEWEVNGKAYKNFSGKGRDVLPLVIMSNTQTILVRITDSLGRISGEQSISIMSRPPHVTFYELHDLYGPRMNKSIVSIDPFPSGSQRKFIAFPYHASIHTLEDILYTWKVNGNRIVGTDPQQYIFSYNAAAGSAATEHISLETSNSANKFERIQGSFTIHVK